MRTYSNLPKQEPQEYVENIRQMLKRCAANYGERSIYVYREGDKLIEHSYIDQYEQVNAFGTALAVHGLSGKRVAVIGDTHPHWVVAFQALICGGSVAVPLDHDLDIENIIEFMRIAECSAVVYTGSFNRKLTARAADMPFIKYFIPIHSDGEEQGDKVLPFMTMIEEGEAALKAGERAFVEHEIDMDAMCSILFTSGTTGTSKGVMLSHRNFTSCANSAAEKLAYYKDFKLVSVLPIHHTYELNHSHLTAPILGTTTFICSNLKYATRSFKEFKPDALILVPLFLETVHKKIWEEIRRKGIEKKVRTAMKLSDSLLRTGVDIRPKLFKDVTAAFGGNLKSIVVGGAPIDPQILKDFYSFGITVLQGYGITECSPLISVNVADRNTFDSVGKAVSCCEAKILPIAGEAEGVGEITVKGDNVMLGYYQNPAATDEVFTEDGWFRTGDIGRIDKNGNIHITGRSKNVIIASNGKNVFPEELEEYLMRIDAIKECVVIGRSDEAGGTIITAIVVPDTDVVGEDATDADISESMKQSIAKINRSLPAYKHINKFEIRREDFERTLSKKIKRFLVK